MVTKKLSKPVKKIKGSAPLSRFQKFETQTVKRTDIKGADYNPRQIDEHAKKKLRANLKRVGLLAPLVWNKRTGNLVSGHQRLSIMDTLEGSDDYSLTLAVVDLSEKEEREQNLFFNNSSAMGKWDEEKLAEMLGDTNVELDVPNTGFDDVDLEVILGQEPNDETAEAIDALAEVGEQPRPRAPRNTAPSDDEGDENNGEPDSDPTPAPTETVDGEELSEEQKQKFRDWRKLWRKAAKDSKVDTEYYMVLFFASAERKEAFATLVGAKDGRHIDGEKLIEMLGLQGVEDRDDE